MDVNRHTADRVTVNDAMVDHPAMKLSAAGEDAAFAHWFAEAQKILPLGSDPSWEVIEGFRAGYRCAATEPALPPLEERGR